MNVGKMVISLFGKVENIVGHKSCLPVQTESICPQKKINVSEIQDVFVKHECPCNSHFLKIVILIFDLDR